ncbi:NUDIX hydrolase [Rhodotorula paludigena]|uniref:NUDIX hydrolase n=1 Tax=Rhodotorula paludigena TaxID=86838 RepID=UPI00316F00BD
MSASQAGSTTSRLFAALRSIHLTPARRIASPPATGPGAAVGSQKRASVAIIIRLRPEHPPPASTAPSTSTSPGASPFTSTVPLQPSPPISPGSVDPPQASSYTQAEEVGSSTASSISAKESVLAQLDGFFAQPWVQNPTTSIEILYIKRTTRTSDKWSGHVAFPGGRSEPDDESAEFTALRETWEEVGLDLAEKDWISIGQLDDREITTSLGKRLLMILSPFVFLHTSPYPPVPELQETEVASAHWIPLDLLHAPAAKYGRVPIDIATRLAPRNRFARWALHMLMGKMDFKCILLPNDPVAAAQQMPQLAPGQHPPELKLWGLTLGMTLDLLSHMTLPASPADLSTYPYGLAALDTPLGGRKGPAKQAELAPFAPAEASIFPRFSYPDINFLIWLFAFRYRRLLRHPSNASSRPTPPATPRPKAPHSRVNWAGMSLNAYYAAVRRALVVAVLLRAVAAVGGLVAAGWWVRARLAGRKALLTR